MTQFSAPKKFNTEKVRFVLEKRNIHDIPCQVKFAMDVSGSAKWLFENGTVQAVTDRIFTIAMTVDMDKSLDFLVFDSYAHELEAVTEKNIHGYIDKHITKSLKYWGGTNYAPAIGLIVESVAAPVVPVKPKSKGLFGGLFGAKEVAPVAPVSISESDPVLGILITDGACGDRGATEQALIQSQGLNVYWQLVGIGPDESQFEFLKTMGEKYPNVGYTPITNIQTMDEEVLYDSLLNDEFAEWVIKFR